MKRRMMQWIAPQTSHIKALDEYSINVVNEANEPFPVIGNIILSFFDGVWRYDEQLYEKAHETCFPADSGIC